MSRVSDKASERGKRAAPGDSRGMWWIASVLTLAAAIVPAVLWVGDISWMQDEPRLLAKAYHANQRGSIETHGLNGNFGVPYGALPTQIYQLLLLITHDPITLAAIRAGLCAGITALGLLWLARALRLNPWFATAIVLAPYVWNFHRIMWDASFAVPIGTIALAAYAWFLRTSSDKSLLVAGACTLGLVFIHPQDLPLAIPIGVHMLWRQRSALARQYIGVAIILGVTIALNAVYVRKAFQAVSWHLDQGSMKTAYDGTQSRAQSLLTPLLGGSILSGNAFAEKDSRLPDTPILRAAKIGSIIIYPMIWAGICIVVVQQLKRWRRVNDIGRREPDETNLAAARQAIFGIALAGLILQMLLYGAMRMPVFPQYFFGTFILHVLFAWIAVDALSRWKLDWVAIAIYGVSVAYITIASTIHIHHYGYARLTFRPSLANQVQVARELNRYADESVLTNVVLYQSHPQAIRSLRLLIPPEPGQIQTASGRLLIRHRSGPLGTDSAIDLVEAPPGFEPGAEFQTLDVTPLPPEWVPAGWQRLMRRPVNVRK